MVVAARPMSLAPRLRRAGIEKLYRAKRLLLRGAPALDRIGLRALRIADVAHARDLAGRGVEHLRTLLPGGPVSLGVPPDDPFLTVAKHYGTGTFVRPDVFVCEVPGGTMHVGTGMVLTAGGTVVEESVLEYRLPYTSVFGGLRPFRVPALRGAAATIFTVFSGNFWHWLVDSLPRLHSLAAAAPPGERVALVLPDSLSQAQRDGLAALLPPGFDTRFLPRSTWVSADRILLPSFLTNRSNGFLPESYVAFVRDGMRRAFGVDGAPAHRERIWVSRAGAGHRRVRNEAAVVDLLAALGFRAVRPESLTMREQVELFGSAEIVVGPHGAGLGGLLFAGAIPVVILYPNRVPNTHFFTMCCGLGQKHDFVLHDADGEDADFDVDVPRLAEAVGRALS